MMYVLVLFYMGAGIATADFNTQAACDAALQKAVSMSRELSGGVKGYCAPKG